MENEIKDEYKFLIPKGTVLYYRKEAFCRTLEDVWVNSKDLVTNGGLKYFDDMIANWPQSMAGWNQVVPSSTFKCHKPT